MWHHCSSTFVSKSSLILEKDQFLFLAGRKHTKQREHFFSLNDFVILCESEVGRWAHNLDILVAAPFPRKPTNESIIFSKFVVMSFKLLSSSQLARRRRRRRRRWRRWRQRRQRRQCRRWRQIARKNVAKKISAHLENIWKKDQIYGQSQCWGGKNICWTSCA